MCLEDVIESASELDVFSMEVVVDVVKTLCLIAGQRVLWVVAHQLRLREIRGIRGLKNI